MSMLKRRDQK